MTTLYKNRRDGSACSSILVVSRRSSLARSYTSTKNSTRLVSNIWVRWNSRAPPTGDLMSSRYNCILSTLLLSSVANATPCPAPEKVAFDNQCRPAQWFDLMLGSDHSTMYTILGASLPDALDDGATGVVVLEHTDDGFVQYITVSDVDRAADGVIPSYPHRNGYKIGSVYEELMSFDVDGYPSIYTASRVPVSLPTGETSWSILDWHTVTYFGTGSYTDCRPSGCYTAYPEVTDEYECDRLFALEYDIAQSDCRWAIGPTVLAAGVFVASGVGAGVVGAAGGASHFPTAAAGLAYLETNAGLAIAGGSVTGAGGISLSYCDSYAKRAAHDYTHYKGCDETASSGGPGGGIVVPTDPTTVEPMSGDGCLACTAWTVDEMTVSEGTLDEHGLRIWAVDDVDCEGWTWLDDGVDMNSDRICDSTSN